MRLAALMFLALTVPAMAQPDHLPYYGGVRETAGGNISDTLVISGTGTLCIADTAASYGDAMWVPCSTSKTAGNPTKSPQN